ncbi:glucosamine--fructose-6-phosphate aminotransferase [Paramecium bursaria Chlorella virus MA1E]|uniref:glutamine--fructose-6-phosphate transaminase (isomerizing) n=1 Tax=Chlorella virus TaxID=10507 RepID=Q76DQ7_9PHYC|nr:glucosamine--fructose-6-phosphate aminotransferase [Paramecium bursaria Chlorella virus MA1E]BAD15299.1 glutamine:fructose-6-phosphate amidotransferase GFAT [Chlorella virus]
MCGIFGAVSNNNSIEVSIKGIQKLEYRGYDSCGIAYADGDGVIERIRSIDGIEDLRKKTLEESSPVAIAHSRWSTTGIPSVVNAHPHISRGTSGCESRIAVVHNGIIENYQQIRKYLINLGYTFDSQTDTEVIAHLIDSQYNGNILHTVQMAVKHLKGSYAIAVMCHKESGKIVVAKQKSPLVLGIGSDGAYYIASDVLALPTNKVVYISDGFSAELSPGSMTIYDPDGNEVEYEVEDVEMEQTSMSLDNFDHYMIKEINEQPISILNTIKNKGFYAEIFGDLAHEIFQKIDNILILACGTSYHAGLVGKQWIETIARIPVDVHIASEYEPTIPRANTLVITISQSGETADTIAALQRAQNAGMIYTLCICNSPKSTLVRESVMKYITKCGSEVSVASTKAFTSQLVVLYMLANVLANKTDDLLGDLPQAIERVICLTNDEMKRWADEICTAKSAIFLGRGLNAPVAFEGALKLKEISYIHAEGFLGGELKHGPLALLDDKIPVIVTVADHAYLDHIKANIDEVLARNVTVYAIVDQYVNIEPQERLHVVKVPFVSKEFSPIIHTIPMQLLSYYVAIKLGKNVDKPRNLAKSVTTF